MSIKVLGIDLGKSSFHVIGRPRYRTLYLQSRGEPYVIPPKNNRIFK